MYEEKLKDQIDLAFDAKCAEYDRKKAAGIDMGKKQRPKRVTSWSAVAQKEYPKESEDVKRIVEEAVKARILEMEMETSIEGQSLEEDATKKSVKLEQYVAI